MKGLHFTPYLPTVESATTAQPPDTSRLSIPAGEECEPIGVVGGSSAEGAGEAAERTADPPPRHHGALTRYLTAEARPTYATLPWAREAHIEERFTAIQQLDEHPFAYHNNLIYVLSTDFFRDTVILEALIERRYLSEDELTSTRREIGDIWVTEVRTSRMFGIFIKDHVNNKPVRQDMKNCIKTLNSC